jgi:hypothetical protein
MIFSECPYLVCRNLYQLAVSEDLLSFFDGFGSRIFAISVPLAQQITTTCLILLINPLFTAQNP